ncbi:uncharacterized protein V6R79_026307 [Siganus canaliculatus]
MASLVPLLVLYLLYLSSFAATLPLKGLFDAVHLNQTIKAVEGDNVILQYSLASGENLVDQTVDWKRIDLNEQVHAYRHGRDLPAPQYSNRASLDHEDLRRGVVTLHLSSVQLSDSGLYRGYIPDLEVPFYVDLHVVKKQQQNETERPESSTVGPSVKDAADVGFDWKIVQAAAAAVVPILAVVTCYWKSRNIHKL